MSPSRRRDSRPASTWCDKTKSRSGCQGESEVDWWCSFDRCPTGVAAAVEALVSVVSAGMVGVGIRPKKRTVTMAQTESFPSTIGSSIRAGRPKATMLREASSGSALSYFQHSALSNRSGWPLSTADPSW